MNLTNEEYQQVTITPTLNLPAVDVIVAALDELPGKHSRQLANYLQSLAADALHALQPADPGTPDEVVPNV